MTVAVNDGTQLWRTLGLALSALGGCALGVFLAKFYGFSSEYSSAICGIGAFIILLSIGLQGFVGAVASVLGPMIFGVGAAWAFGTVGLNSVVFMVGMVMAMAGLIIRIFNDN